MAVQVFEGSVKDSTLTTPPSSGSSPHLHTGSRFL